jgi:RNA polymerase sigma-70 factor (ECF subfamily)
MENTDSQLIDDYLDGNEEALSLLINRHLKMVYNYAYSICKNSSDAEDISQEVFLKVWKKIKKYDPKQNFKTWILTITRNTTIDWLRKKRPLVFSDFENSAGENTFIENITDEEILPDEVFAKVEDAKMLESLLGKISPKEREVLDIRYRQDMTFEEVATILGKPIDTVKSIHRRALIKIRGLL